MKLNLSFFAIFLLIIVTILPGCKNRNESKKETVIPPASGSAIKNMVPDISIHEAALNGKLSDVTQLLERGTDPNLKDEEGRTPLMYAAFNGYTEIMQKLIEKGALVDLRDAYGRTALMLASSGPFPAAVKLLLGNKADPDLADTEEHFTAIMFAASEGQLEVVKILLKSKANPALKDVDGDDAMTFAKNNGHSEVVNLLKANVK